MATTRRRFSPAFKDEAVRLVTEAGVSVAQAARDLDVHENVLRKWVRASRQSQSSSQPAHFTEQSELEQLRRENRRLRMERDILKKATAFFAKDSN